MSNNNVPSANSGSFNGIQSIVDAKTESPLCLQSKSLPLDELCYQLPLSDLSLDSTDDDYSENDHDTYFNVPPSELDYVHVKISDSDGKSIVTPGTIIFDHIHTNIPIEEMTSMPKVCHFCNNQILLPGAFMSTVYAIVGGTVYDTDRWGVVVIFASELRDFNDNIRFELVDNA